AALWPQSAPATNHTYGHACAPYRLPQVAIASVALVTLFYEEPLYSLEITAPDTIVKLAVFVIAAFVVSHLTDRLRAATLPAPPARPRPPPSCRPSSASATGSSPSIARPGSRTSPPRQCRSCCHTSCLLPG